MKTLFLLLGKFEYNSLTKIYLNPNLDKYEVELLHLNYFEMLGQEEIKENLMLERLKSYKMSVFVSSRAFNESSLEFV